MLESKNHFLRVAAELCASPEEVPKAMADSLRRQIALSLVAGFLEEKDLVDIEREMPKGIIYFDGNILHETPASL